MRECVGEEKLSHTQVHRAILMLCFHPCQKMRRELSAGTPHTHPFDFVLFQLEGAG